MLVFFALFFILTLLRSQGANDKGESYVRHIDTLSKFFPALFSSAFTLLILIINFKSTEKDGSDLLIVSKPIRRSSMFFSKILITALFVISFQVLAFFAYWISATTDRNSTFNTRVRFAASISLGGMLYQAILLSILLVFAAFSNTLSLISLGLLFSAVAPIVSLVLAQVGNGVPRDGWKPFQASLLKISELHKNESKDLSSDEKLKLIDLETEWNTRPMGTEAANKELAAYYHWREGNWYKDFAKYDIWSHWGGFMDMFVQRDSTDKRVAQDWYPTAGMLQIDPRNTMEVEFEANGVVNKHRLAFLLNPGNLNINSHGFVESRETYNTLSVFYDVYRSLKAKGFITNNSTNTSLPTDVDYNALSPAEKGLLKSLSIFMSSKLFFWKIDNLMIMDNLMTLPYKVHFTMTLLDDIKANSNFAIYSKTTGVSKWMKYTRPTKVDEAHRPSILIADKPNGLWISKPYVKKETSFYIWLPFAFVMFMIATCLYWKKEIK